MSLENSQQGKTRLHPRNKNQKKYDLVALVNCKPQLNQHIKLNKLGDQSLDFSNPKAVKLLNKAILHYYYGIENWDFPDKNLCPPIPGRADYIHHMADLICESNNSKMPKGEKITCLDVGLGANCIYPIIGVTEYDWNFIGTDIDSKSIMWAEQIINSNELLKDKVSCRLQKNSSDIFKGIISKEEKIDLTICNPPFHSSLENAQTGTQRKIKNLTGKKNKTTELNFAGISHELICEGGEELFIQNIIRESKTISKNCFWFSTLVSKQSNLKGIYTGLEKNKVIEIRTISLETGNKSSRIVSWTFLSKEEQNVWRETRWQT